MSHSTLTILITVLAAILFATEKIPIAITALLISCFLVLTGVLTVSQAFSGFGSSTVMLLIGVMIMGEACMTTGVALQIGTGQLRMFGKSEKYFVVMLYFTAAVLAIFLNSTAIAAIFLPVIDSVSRKTSGEFSRKHAYMPMVLGSIYGGGISLIGTTAMVNASAQLADSSFGRGFNFFEPLPIMAPACIMIGLFFVLFGYRLQVRFFDFKENCPTDHSGQQVQELPHEKRKMIIVLVTLAICIVLLVTRLIDIGVVALLGACVLVITGCIDQNTALRSINWSSIFVVMSSLGLAKALDVSGAGEILATAIIRICGSLGSMPFAMCAILCVLSSFLSNFMSANAAVGITVPIALNIAQSMGVSPLPFALGCSVGAVVATSTPICKAPLSVISVVGYRYKDYIRIGGLCNLIAIICCLLNLYLVYFRG